MDRLEIIIRDQDNNEKNVTITPDKPYKDLVDGEVVSFDILPEKNVPTK